MKRQMTSQTAIILIQGLLLLGLGQPALAQRAQDNWYLETSWARSGGTLSATNGGLSTPYGVAIGPDGKVYVGDESYSRIQVYQPDGTYAFSITNTFGGGLSFSQPRGMVFGPDGNLYIADQGRYRVFVFTPDGQFVRQIGTSSGTGQLSGVKDVGVSRDGEVFALQSGTQFAQVSVFSTTGDFLRSWSGYGTMTAQLYEPGSIAVSPDGRVFISTKTDPTAFGSGSVIKVFRGDGIYITRIQITTLSWDGGGYPYNILRLPCSLRFDYGGLLHAVADHFYVPHEHRNYVTYFVLTPDGTTLYSMDVSGGTEAATTMPWPCAAVGKDGAAFVFIRDYKAGYRLRHALREQWAPPRNAIPQPCVITKQQRTSSPLVDIDYQVTDIDDTNVTVGALIFTNSSATPSLAACIRNPTFVEGTSSNLGPSITANEVHRLTWSAGADWSVNLGDYRAAILAQDSRTNLLDIHYLSLPADNGMPALKISRSPLTANDFMQVWWWLLATGDPGISLASNQIFGVSGAYSATQLCTNATTTALGRSYIYEKMSVREATGQEVQWAKQGNMPPGSSPNQWSPTRSVASRPSKVNEWGFDTGSWDTNTCKWVVPLP